MIFLSIHHSYKSRDFHPAFAISAFVFNKAEHIRQKITE